MESLFALLETVISTDNLFLYIGMIVEGVVSIFLWKKSDKPKTNAQVVDKDISALIDYHEKVANELRKKNNSK